MGFCLSCINKDKKKNSDMFNVSGFKKSYNKSLYPSYNGNYYNTNDIFDLITIEKKNKIKEIINENFIGIFNSDKKDTKDTIEVIYNNKKTRIKIICVNDDYCIKIFSKNVSKKLLLFSENEIKNMKKINYDGCVKYIKHVENNNNILLFMEYAKEGDLYKIIKEKDNTGYFHNDEILQIFCQVLLGLYYLHNKNIIHKDIKSANIIVSKYENNYIYKFADFGFSIDLSEINFENDTNDMNCLCGTPKYMAPEIWLSEKADKSSDMWSLGILLHEITYLTNPFNDIEMDKLKESILEKKDLNLFEIHNISKNILTLIYSLIMYDRTKRATVEDLIFTPYIYNFLTDIKDKFIGLDIYEQIINIQNNFNPNHKKIKINKDIEIIIDKKFITLYDYTKKCECDIIKIFPCSNIKYIKNIPAKCIIIDFYKYENIKIHFDKSDVYHEVYSKLKDIIIFFDILEMIE
jgi:serine/threonine protein kinase